MKFEIELNQDEIEQLHIVSIELGMSFEDIIEMFITVSLNDEFHFHQSCGEL